MRGQSRAQTLLLLCGLLLGNIAAAAEPGSEPSTPTVAGAGSAPAANPSMPAQQLGDALQSAVQEIAKQADKVVRQAGEELEKAVEESKQALAKEVEKAAESVKKATAKPMAEIAQAMPRKEYKDPFPEDIRRIKDRGKLIVAQFHGQRPGFFMLDEDRRAKFADYPYYMDGDKRVVGYDIEIARRIAQRLGVDLEIRRTQKSFNDITRAVANGEADIGVSKITITMARGQYVRFTKPYVTLRIGLLINRLKELELAHGGEGDLMSLLNHPDTRIAVQKGTSWVTIGKDLFPKAQLVQYPNMKSAMDAALNGETVAFLNDEWNISAKLQKNPEITLRVRLAFVPDKRSGLAIAVSPEAPNLLAFLNLMVDGDGLVTTPPKLLNRYFEEGSAQMVASTMAAAEDTESRSDISTLAAGIAIGVVVLLGFVWVRMANGATRATTEE